MGAGGAGDATDEQDEEETRAAAAVAGRATVRRSCPVAADERQRRERMRSEKT